MVLVIPFGSLLGMDSNSILGFIVTFWFGTFHTGWRPSESYLVVVSVIYVGLQ